MPKYTYTKAYKKGEIIFKEGDVGDCAYLIDSGRIEIQVTNLEEGTTPVAILGVGDILGEMAIIDGSNRSATAVALENCELVEVSKEQLNERVEDADPVVRFLLSILLSRLRETLKDTNDPTRTNLPVEATSTNIVNLSDYKTNAGVVEKIKLEKSLKHALDANEFRVHYQPIADVKSGSIAGFEALMRWNNPERGVVRPDIFMGIAEETSLIVPIGHWIIQRSLRDFAKLKQNLKANNKYHKKMFISINIAAKQFNDPHLFEILNKTAKYYSLAPYEIKLEITERVLLAGNFVFDWIEKARNMGYSVALDDFGTGYSSLSYLANLDVNNLKIDKSFVEKMLKNTKSKNIVKSLVRMAKDLKLSVIAEGVENQKEWEMLKSFGCTYIQGYFYSKPMPMADVFFMMTEQDKKKAA
ncbi:MAG: EAL domain-containing protein [Bacteriovoracaceae bacterium]|nr:EAL domain-containing protein [Bacteriovoracaceae bacterium]